MENDADSATEATCGGASLPPVPCFYEAENYRAEESIGYMMRRIMATVSQSIESQICEPGSPTYPQWLVLYKLHAQKAATVAELARECLLDTGAMTRLLDRLEAKDLCRRVRSVADRRVVNIELTDEGRVAAQAVPHVLCRVQNEHLAGFSEDEWEQLKGYLRRILDNAQILTTRGEKMIRLLPELSTGRAKATAIALAACTFLALAGCADMAGIGSHAKLRDADSLGLGTPVAAMPVAAPSVDARWWTAFNDPQLDALVDQGLEGNPNLQVARARMMRAQAATAAAEAADKPQINGSLDLMRQKFSSNYIYPAPLGGSIQETGNLQLSGSWELDFFGKNRAALDTAIGTANAAAAEVDAARVLLASNIARSYFQWVRLSEQLVVARRTLAQRDETLKLVRDRVSAGLDTRLELRQSEGGLPEARQQIEALNEQVALAQHALDALVGQPNATRSLAPHSLDSVRGMALQAVIPADLLGRRADIAAARWRVEAATSDVANAKTQFYPNINLVAFAGLQSLGFDRLLKSDAQQWGVGPAIRLPIFEGGRLRANLRGKAADLDVAIESYNASVLDAVRDVADQVTSAQSIGRQQAEQREAQTAAEGAYQIAVQRYRAGLGNYLNVLTAETAVLAQRRLAVDLAARALDTQVNLARALGGGWQPPVAVAGNGTVGSAAH